MKVERTRLAKAWDKTFEDTIIPRSNWPKNISDRPEYFKTIPAYFEMFIEALSANPDPVVTQTISAIEATATMDERKRCSILVSHLKHEQTDPVLHMRIARLQSDIINGVPPTDPTWSRETESSGV